MKQNSSYALYQGVRIVVSQTIQLYLIINFIDVLEKAKLGELGLGKSRQKNWILQAFTQKLIEKEQGHSEFFPVAII